MGNRISYRDVLRHHANGRSIREIAAACSCSSSAVQDILARADESGVGWDDVAPLTDGEARRLVRGNPGKGDVAFAAIDFERIDAEMARDRTMTLSVLWVEYYASAVSRGERPYLYSRFCELYAKHRDDAGVKGRKTHVPGDLGELDFAGKTMDVYDELTGEATAAYLFVACLPFSQKAYVRADPSMDTDHWIEQSTLAFEFFGGVPRLLAIDNLKWAAAHFKFNGGFGVMRSSRTRPAAARGRTPHYILVSVGPRRLGGAYDRRSKGLRRGKGRHQRSYFWKVQEARAFHGG